MSNAVENGFNQAQRKRVIESQRYALMQHGYHPHSLLWSNTEVQEIRFKILSEVGITKNDSVLDVGCGFGDFAKYLTKQGKPVKFTGIDVSNELLEVGHKYFPELNLIQGDLFDLNPEPQSYDYVSLSGALNRKYDGASDYTFQIIARMFDVCRKGIAFNLLDARHQWTAGRWDLQSFHPDEIIEFSKNLLSKKSDKETNSILVVDDYLENDFTVYLYKETFT